MIDLKVSKIGEIVANDYRKAAVFKKFGIDFCCGGGISIDKACEKKGLDFEEVRDALEALDVVENTNMDYNSWSLDFLCDYIINLHHAYVKENISLINGFARKVAKVHGDKHPELIQIEANFNKLAQELTFHMHKEEQILFPYIKQLAKADLLHTSLPKPGFITVQNPIKMMELEHDEAGNITKEIDRLTHHYTLPEDACTTYRVFYAKLEEFENDLNKHVHLENNILFPKAIQLEQQKLSK